MKNRWKMDILHLHVFFICGPWVWGRRRTVILVFLSMGDKFSPGKQRLLCSKKQADVPAAENNRAAVWPRMTAIWAQAGWHTGPLICLHGLGLCVGFLRLAALFEPWIDHKETQTPIVVSCCQFCSLMPWDSTRAAWQPRTSTHLSFSNLLD